MPTPLLTTHYLEIEHRMQNSDVRGLIEYFANNKTGLGDQQLVSPSPSPKFNKTQCNLPGLVNHTHLKFDLKLPDCTTSIDWQQKRMHTLGRSYEAPQLSPSLKEEFHSFL